MNAVPQRWNDDKIDALSEKVDGLNGRFNLLERHVENGFNRLDARIDKLDGKIDALRREMASRFDRLLFGLLGSATAIIAALIAAPHL